MRKLLNRPVLALATVLALIFVIVLIKSYCKLVDKLTISLSEIQESEQIQESESIASESENSDISSETKSIDKSIVRETIGPVLPNYVSESKPAINREITLGTFEALNGTCFLQKDWKYESLYVTSDKFSDVQDAVDRFKAKTFDEDKKVDSLFDLLDVSYSTYSENSLTRFYSEINRYRMYSNESKTVDDLLYDMQTKHVKTIEEKDGGTQFKLTITFESGVVALFKPMRVSREQEALPNQIYFAEYERHTSEIAAFHLDRVLNFRRAVPVVGRKLNLISDILRIAEPALQRTFFISPKPDENICFNGNCKQFCDGYHPICGNGTYIEGSLMAFFPGIEGAERTTKSHPWAQSYSKNKLAPWETDPFYCEKVMKLSQFSQGRLLLELIDMSIFDFLTGNMDRHNFQRFNVFGNDTFTLRYDHGRAFGKAFHDELKILAPMLQCCMIKSSTLQTLLDFHNSPAPLSQRMRESLADDPLAPILWPPHLQALDRRVTVLLQAIRDCISRYPEDKVLITTDILP